MENFKQASKLNLKVQTTKGELSVAQLWTLTLLELDTLAVSLQEEHEKSGKKSFLTKTSSKDQIAKLKFDIVLEILNDKKAEKEAATKTMEEKKYNEKIFSLIAEKKDESLKGKSVKQLESMLIK